MTYLERQAAEKQALADIYMRTGRQEHLDLTQIALNRKFGFGEKRLWELLMEIKELHEYFRPAFDIKHPECDWYREQLDRALAQCCGTEHPLIPFSERYDDLKQVSYGRKKR